MNCYLGNGLILPAVLLAASAQALTIDADKYFAYAVARNGEAYLLSRAVCDLDMSRLEGKWKQAGVQGRTGYFPPTRACWDEVSDPKGRYRDSVIVCTYPDLAACTLFDKSFFIDTATLPKQADF